jgi:hypothetical protein
MLNRFGFLLIAASLCYGAEVGVVAKGAIQSRTKDELIINTNPCDADLGPMKFLWPWKEKRLGTRKCSKSNKNYDEYRVEQLKPEDKTPSPVVPPGDKGAASPTIPPADKGAAHPDTPPNAHPDTPPNNVDMQGAGAGNEIKKKSRTPER